MEESSLTKGQIRKLNALRKSIGNDIGEQAFSKWLKAQTKEPVVRIDPVVEKLTSALSGLVSDPSVRLGRNGYSIKRAKGKGASGFVITKNT